MFSPKRFVDRVSKTLTPVEEFALRFPAGSVPPAEIVEGIVYEMSLQIGEALGWVDTCFTRDPNPKESRQLDALKLSYVINRAYVDPIVAVLAPIHPATLSHRVRDLRRLLTEHQRRLHANDIVRPGIKRANNRRALQHVRDVVEFVAAYHKVGHVHLPDEERAFVLDHYLAVEA